MIGLEVHVLIIAIMIYEGKISSLSILIIKKKTEFNNIQYGNTFFSNIRIS